MAVNDKNVFGVLNRDQSIRRNSLERERISQDDDDNNNGGRDKAISMNISAALLFALAGASNHLPAWCARVYIYIYIYIYQYMVVMCLYISHPPPH